MIASASPTLGKILVVDDITIIQRTIYFALRDLGYQILLAGELTEALNLVRQEKPDLILLDINFPPEVEFPGGFRDGFGALQWMQRIDELKDIPIIMISSDEATTASPRAQTAGAAAFLHKPISKDKLLLTVAELLRQKKSGLLAT